MNTGFAPSSVLQSAAIRPPQVHSAHVAAHVPHPAVHAPKVGAVEVAGKGAVTADTANAPKLTADQKQVAQLQMAKTVAMAPAQLDFVGILGGGLLVGATKKFKWDRATAAIGAVLMSPVHALRHTEIRQASHLVANYVDDVALKSKEAGGKAQGWATAAEKHAANLHASASTFDGRVAKATSGLRTAVGERIDAFADTSLGKKLHGALDSLMHKRKYSAATKHTKLFKDVDSAFHTEGVGFWKGIKNRITGTKAASTEELGALSAIKESIEKAELHTGATKAEHLHEAMHSLEGMMNGDALKGEIKARAGNVAKHLQKLVGNTHALDRYETAAGGTLKDMAKTALKAAGSIKVFNLLIGAGVVAGVGAVAVAANAESKESKKAFKQVKAELADKPQSSFLKAIKAAQKSGQGWGALKTGMKLASEPLEGAMWMLPGGGGAGLMAAMMGPQLCTMLVPDNMVLGALVALEKHDEGAIKLEPAARIELVKQLVGAMPAVVEKGGIHNHLVTPVAKEIDKRGLSRSQIVQLLGDDKKFGEFASEVSSKLEAEAKASAANANIETTKAAPKIDGPTTRIGVGAVDAQHHGTVQASAKRAVG